LKKWECVQVNHHKSIGKTIEEWEQNGWQLNTYVCSGFGPGASVNHYLLFERETKKELSSSEAAVIAAAI